MTQAHSAVNAKEAENEKESNKSHCSSLKQSQYSHLELSMLSVGNGLT